MTESIAKPAPPKPNPTPAPPTQNTIFRADQTLHTIFALILLFAAFITALALAVLWRASSTPSWWASVSPSDPAAIQRAESLEIRLNNSLTSPRTPSIHAASTQTHTWTIDITPDEANAWVNLRLPKWLANRGLPAPFEPGSLSLAFRDGKLIAGAKLPSSKDDHQIVAVTLAPSIDDSSNLIAPITSFHLGALTLPRALAADRLDAFIPPEYADDPDVTRALRALLDAEPLADAPTISIDDHRAIRITRIDITPSGATLHCTTLPND